MDRLQAKALLHLQAVILMSVTSLTVSEVVKVLIPSQMVSITLGAGLTATLLRILHIGLVEPLNALILTMKSYFVGCYMKTLSAGLTTHHILQKN